MPNSVSIEELRAALDAGELVFHYQPKVSMVLGTLCGAEALIRWCKSDGTTIGPGAFIPLAESTGFITDITCRMLDTLVADLVIARAAAPTLTLSFNASARDFDDDRLVEAILRLIDLGIVAANGLEIELTESAVLDAGPALHERLYTLRSRGVQLAMDDFGTGYSSIDTLSKLPFTAVKIDQGLIGRMGTSAKDATIVESSIRMGHRIGIDVVAEGIETESNGERPLSTPCSPIIGSYMRTGCVASSSIRPSACLVGGTTAPGASFPAWRLFTISVRLTSLCTTARGRSPKRRRRERKWQSSCRRYAG